MAGTREARIDAAVLERLLLAADPAVVLVRPRLLRRAKRASNRFTGLGLWIAARRTHVLQLEQWQPLAGRGQIRGRPEDALVILFCPPNARSLAQTPAEEVLGDCWRSLFHARVQATIRQRCLDGKLGEATLRERIHRIGQVQYDEVRAVLRHEEHISEHADLCTSYEAFAALFLELYHFAPKRLNHVFPGLSEPERVWAILNEDVDSRLLFARTRLEGAPDPHEPVENPSERTYRHMLVGADGASNRGNVVRAAILRVKAADAAAPQLVERTHAAARQELDRLTERLQAALALTDQEAVAWRAVLPELLPKAAEGRWTGEGRLLYDLQQVCIDHERPVFGLNLVDWLLALGRRPIQRPLPGQREVQILRHLRRAAVRLRSARLASAARERLHDLLANAIHDGEHKLRERFRPAFRQTLEEVGLRPQNLPERIAAGKLVEELLDRLSERGYCTMSDLRDAIARNQLKLPDLASLIEVLVGDPLIRANRRLAATMPGTYHGGEIYLRLLQGLSSLAFGTPVGRLLIRYVVLPFGGAYVAMEGLQYALNHVVEWFGPAPAEAEHAKVEHHGLHLVSLESVGLCGVFFFALLHVPVFRAWVWRSLRWCFTTLSKVVVELPVWLLTRPIVQRLLASWPVQLLWRWLIQPGAVTALAGGGLAFLGVTGVPLIALCGLTYLAALLIANTQLMRDLEESCLEWLAGAWQRINVDLVPRLFQMIMDAFRLVLEYVDWLLYTVDEWLRFRSGESRFILVAKTVLGFFWFFVAYVIRFYVVLLIEPQINPIKHFPTVTVAAKMMLPMSGWNGPLTNLLAWPLQFLGPTAARSIAFANIWVLPGFAGFLVWELRANWLLYRANRPRNLEPVTIGAHGETMLRLLKPGFHSGTLPKLFKKLRRAEHQGQQTGDWRSFRKYADELHHIEQALQRFVEREFLDLLHASRSWGGVPVRARHVQLGSNRIALELARPDRAARVELVFEEQSGWLTARLLEAEALADLSANQRASLRLALAGLYKLAGVDVLHERLEAQLPPSAFAYDLAGDRLVVWPSDRFDAEAWYSLRDGQALMPQPRFGVFASPLPTLAASILFRTQALTWKEWVAGWDKDQAEGQV